MVQMVRYGNCIMGHVLKLFIDRDRILFLMVQKKDMDQSLRVRQIKWSESVRYLIIHVYLEIYDWFY
jgi:hypothetical protein